LPFNIEVETPERCIGCYSCVYACSRHLFNAVDSSRTAVFVRTQRTLQNSFTVVMCRFCKEPECAYACPREALLPLPEGGITLIAEKCRGCETYECVRACKLEALALDKRSEFLRPIICDRCGDCAKFCPHNVFRYQEMKL